LAESGDVVQSFGAVGVIAAQNTTINDFAARISGIAGARATSSQQAADSAVAVYTEVSQRRDSVEGVNIDEELVKMTQYQQAYNAASRMMQAANEMLDTLMQLV
jgi:flagellar hook-associated protein 1 FlgK